jgi:hypothetical protein
MNIWNGSTLMPLVLLDDVPTQERSGRKDYSVIGGYRVADYKEQSHTYAEEEQVIISQ